jgi:large subunit ribosomal protein L30
MSSTLQITQVRSAIGTQQGHRRTLRALGLRKIHQTVTQPDRPEIRGMIGKVAHLVEVSYLGEDAALDLEPGQEPKGEGNPPAGQSVADDEAAELAEAVEEALSVEGTADDAADLAQNPPSLSATDEPTKPKPRGGGEGDEDTAAGEEEGA